MIAHKRHEHTEVISSNPSQRRWVGGVALILAGVLMLLVTFTEIDWLGLLLLPLLGVIFLVWGIVAGRVGPIIPGGILTGLGTGLWLSQQVFRGDNQLDAGIITLALGLGFLLIVPLSAYFTKESHWWPSVPGSILVLVGIALFIGGSAMEILSFLGKIWPVALIIIGLFLLWQVVRRKPAE